MNPYLFVPFLAMFSLEVYSEEWAPSKALAVAEIFNDTTAECKAYAKYRIEKKFAYCEKIPAQKPRVQEMMAWLSDNLEELTANEQADILRDVRQGLNNYEYLVEVGVF